MKPVIWAAVSVVFTAGACLPPPLEYVGTDAGVSAELDGGTDAADAGPDGQAAVDSGSPDGGATKGAVPCEH